jgi:AcrR family transcriptional regulator
MRVKASSGPGRQRQGAGRRTTGRPAPVRASYHHGDLRRALIEAAQEILEGAGVSGLTLRAAARKAGVSPAAPYRHFADKEALLAAVAEQGFRALSALIRQAASPPGSDRASGFRGIGLAYIRFAVEHPARFRLMFGRELADRERYGPLKEAARETFGMLVAAIESGQRGDVIRPGDAQELSMAAWAIVHGLSALLVDGQLAPATEDLDTFASRVLQALFLGLRKDSAPR